MPLLDECVKSYLRNISQEPLISREYEDELADLIADGSEKAREKLIMSNLRLVVKIANDFKSLGLPLSDLISEGNIGLMRAVEKFKPGMGAKFSSYGAWWIKQAIRRAIAEQSRIIRIPVQSAMKIRRIQRVAMELAESIGRIPSEEEIAEASGYSKRTVHTLKTSATRGCISLQESLQTGEDGTVEDVIPDLDMLLPDDSLNVKDLKILIVKIVNNRLKERERMIIKMRYGLDGETQRTLEEVSTIVGRTRERVRQIQHEALRKLAFHLSEEDAI